MFTSTIQPAIQKAEFLESKKTNENSLLNGRTVKPLLLNSKEKGELVFLLLLWAESYYLLRLSSLLPLQLLLLQVPLLVR